MLRAIEFFAGSGLVRLGLEPGFTSVWSNDFSEKKRATYEANFGGATFHPGPIEEVDGSQIPAADLAWASFPCQDLSLAGNMSGMDKGTRSGLFWEWIRLLWELRALGRCPPVLAAENVGGFLVADGGRHFVEAYAALRELGYKVGTVVLNSRDFVPQSRVRAFIVAVRDGIELDGLTQPQPSLPFHTSALLKAVGSLENNEFVWWSLPAPTKSIPSLSDLCDFKYPADSSDKTEYMLSLLTPGHRRRVDALVASGASFAGTAYRRTRRDATGKSVQRFEIRFDGIAGCLRTPDGGSSRQSLLIVEKGKVSTRLLTTRECARLMGAPDSFHLAGTDNDAYRAMGDAVTVPVTRWLSRYLLEPLALRASGPSPDTACSLEPGFGPVPSMEFSLHA